MVKVAYSRLIIVDHGPHTSVVPLIQHIHACRLLIHLLQLCYTLFIRCRVLVPGHFWVPLFQYTCHLFFADCLDRPVAADGVFQSMDRSPHAS